MHAFVLAARLAAPMAPADTRYLYRTGAGSALTRPT